jgi:drug/metabolite transporter (DMT)-like permease
MRIDPATAPSWLLPVAVVFLWIGISLIAITSKCLLTDKKCSRWGPQHGADFPYPLHISWLHLFIVGACLFAVLTFNDAVIAKRKPRLFDGRKLRLCSMVGCVFGLKNVVGLMALRETPTATYMLFHALNIVFIALAAWVVVGETPGSIGEIVSLVGIVIGSSISSSESFFSGGEHSIGGFAFLLNVTNGICAGATVATLRWTTLRMGEANMTIAELTCLELLVGAAVIMPIAFVFEGGAVFTINSTQWFWLLVSSVIILIYHLVLSLICYLAPALVVGVVEALKPLPAFVIVALIQKLPHKTTRFWLGTLFTLASAIAFKLSRTINGDSLRRRNSRQYLLESASIQYQTSGRELYDNVPLNERIGNDLESDSDASVQVTAS